MDVLQGRLLPMIQKTGHVMSILLPVADNKSDSTPCAKVSIATSASDCWQLRRRKKLWSFALNVQFGGHGFGHHRDGIDGIPQLNLSLTGLTHNRHLNPDILESYKLKTSTWIGDDSPSSSLIPQSSSCNVALGVQTSTSGSNFVPGACSWQWHNCEDPQPRCMADVVSSIKVSKLCIVRSDLLQIELSNTMIHYHMLVFPVCWDISNLLIIYVVISIHMSQ